MIQQSHSCHTDLEKTLILKNARTSIFIAALLTTDKTWKQPKCPSTDEWIKEMRFIYTMKYYSTVKKVQTSPARAGVQSLVRELRCHKTQCQKTKT